MKERKQKFESKKRRGSVEEMIEEGLEREVKDPDLKRDGG